MTDSRDKDLFTHPPRPPAGEAARRGPKPLGFDFPLMSAISRRSPWSIEADEMLLEVDEELAHRRTFYKRLVDRGQLGEEEAVRHIAVLLAIRSDLAGHWDRSVAWEAKVRELRRELQLRRNAWPKRIASAAHPLSADEARRRMERLDALHVRYWMDLWFHDGTRDDMRRHGAEREAWERAEHAAGNPVARAWLEPAELIARDRRRVIA